MKKKIVITIGLAVLVGLSIYGIIFFIQSLLAQFDEYNFIIQNIEEFKSSSLRMDFVDNFYKVVLRYSFLILLMISNICIYTLIIIYTYKYNIRYSYEKFKQAKEKDKLIKKERQVVQLEEKLNKLKND